MRTLNLATLALCLALMAACGDSGSVPAVPRPAPPPVLRFSGIPNQNTTELAQRYRPLAEHLAKELGVEVEYVPAADYNATVDAFKNGDILLCWFGGFTGVQARAAVPGARAIACGRRDLAFKSYFIAHRDTRLPPGADFPLGLEGRSFTFGSPSSTSGRLMPEHFIRQACGRSPREFFGSEPGFSGSHDKTIELVQSGAYECGAVDYTVFDKRLAQGQVDPELVHVVWTTPEYADYQFSAHPQLDQAFGAGFIARLQAVLIEIGPEQAALLAALDRPEGLIPCDDSLFDDLQRIARQTGLLR